MSKRTQFSLLRLLRLGIRNDTSFVEVQKTYMFNLFLLVASPFALLSLVVNIYSLSLVPAVFNLIQLTLFGIGFRISYLQKQLQLRPVILLILSFIATLAAYFYKNGSEYRLLVMMIAAVVFFDKTWQYFLFALLVSLSFLLVRLEDMNFSALPVSQNLQQIALILFPLLVFVMSLYYFKHIYFKNLYKLEKTNTALSIAKKQKEKILNTVAHDLRTPISNIAGISQLILTDPQFSKEQKDLVSLIVHATNASLTLINDLLENSEAHMHSALLAPVDLNELIRQYAPLLSISASEKHCSIEYNLTEMALPVYVDSGRIERVINNLVSNAIKFSPPDSVISLNSDKDKDFAIVTVKDHGVGIPPENHQKIFEMYTHAKRKGTAGEQSFGMGLSICKQIVEQHGGHIYLQSEVGEGSNFIVTLPLYSN